MIGDEGRITTGIPDSWEKQGRYEYAHQWGQMRQWGQTRKTAVRAFR